MYTHRLTASKGSKTYEIPCEDSPVSEGLVALWPYDLDIDGHSYTELVMALHAWARSEGLKYRIYVTKDHFEPTVAHEE